MGNLCSSGTERADKKEDNRVPDKPRDGEDEALLAAAARASEGLGVPSEGEVAGTNANGGGGLGGFLSGAVKSGESTLAEVGQTVEEEIQKTGATVVESGKQTAGGVVEDVQTRASAAFSETATSLSSGIEERASRSLEEIEARVSEAFQSAAAKVENEVSGATDQTGNTVSNVVGEVEGGLESLGCQVEGLRNSAEKSVAGEVQSTASAAGSVADRVESSVESADREFEASQKVAVTGVESAVPEISNTISNVQTNAEETASNVQGTFVENVQQGFHIRVDEIKGTVKSVTGDLQQTAENKLKDVVESAQSTVSENVASWTESAGQTIGAVTGNLSEAVTGVAKDVEGGVVEASETVRSTEESLQVGVNTEVPELSNSLNNTVIAAAESTLGEVEASTRSEASASGQFVGNVSEAVASSGADALRDFLDSGEGLSRNVESSAGDLIQNTSQAAEDFQNVISQTTEEVQTQQEDLSEAAIQKFLELESEAAASSAAATAEFQENEIADGLQNIEQEVSNLVREDSLCDAFNRASDTQEELVEVAQEINLRNDPDLENVEPTTTTSENFLEKAKSLLEAHRNSIDSSKLPVPTVSITEDNSEPVDEDSFYQQLPEVEAASHEATAREFVESIIEKATSLVSESLEQQQKDQELDREDSSSSEPSVERGEETLAPKKRGVMFVSPQISDQSSSSISSGQEISPPPPPESDLSPPAESSSSSISQGELVERDELLEPDIPPSEFSLTESNNNNNNILNNNAEDEDESIQRVAMEVTAKAVQDAIKIVAENGTGSVLAPNNHDDGTSLSSSPEENNPVGYEDDDRTTTDSSQVERGSPVSDLTDTSAHDSVSESLSSYDPGAVFRQDVANLSDLPVSPGDNAPTAPPPQQPISAAAQEFSKPTGKVGDLINFEEETNSQSGTPTPTNASSFTTYSPALAETSDDRPKNEILDPLSSDVPSSLPSFESSSPSKPIIVINSPDSAAHTNGSSGETSPQNEALI